ncbi:MAG: biotin carboxylase [Deltaproteobacteria bacterium HGW-Deltaproteobacteria-15]|jgi:carbamoyl-phosphate synthase large subunit|nr:MAG: biotin carboxylase [Deltaproteobacteria bacterium HGW-Deltaproteobacteria-15]
MRKRALNIGVSGLNATDNPGPGVAVIRSIRESGEFEGIVTGLAYNPLDPGAYMDGICDNAFLIPYPSLGAESLLERIRAIHSMLPLDVIIPTLDSELSLYLKIRSELVSMGIHTYLPNEETFNLRSKARFHRLRDIGVNVPKGKTVSDASAVYALEKEYTFPVMVKGQFYEAFISYSPMEAASHFFKLSSKWGLPVVIQEYIQGTEYDVVALGDGKGGLVGAVPMKKMQLTDQGKAWGGITIADEGMNEFVRSVMGKLKWRGPCELEVMKAKHSGECYLIEVNPRFPAWCYLAAGAGQNLAWAAVRLALGEEVEPFSTYQVGTLFLRHSVEHIYPLSQYRSLAIEGQLIRIEEKREHGKA